MQPQEKAAQQISAHATEMTEMPTREREKPTPQQHHRVKETTAARKPTTFKPTYSPPISQRRSRQNTRHAMTFSSPPTRSLG